MSKKPKKCFEVVEGEYFILKDMKNFSGDKTLKRLAILFKFPTTKRHKQKR